MGYSTDFNGKLTFDKPLTAAQGAYVNKFHETRRMKRNEKIASELPDPLRNAVGLPVGKEGQYFVGAKGLFGQEDDASVINHNTPPNDQPSLWCQWEITDDGKYLQWDGSEKFYDYVEWLKYMIENFFAPWGNKLTGTITWQGEEMDDRGAIVVKDNVVKTARYVLAEAE